MDFTGEAPVALQRLRDARAALKFEDGSWKLLNVTGPNNTTEQLYVGPDRNDRQKKESQLTKKYLAALKASPEFLGKDISIDRLSRSISINWVPVVQVQSPEKHRQFLGFKAKGLAKLGMERAPFRSVWNDLCATVCPDMFEPDL